MIKVTNLIKKYGEKTALDNISFEVHKGTILGVLGRNGAGKSTLFRSIMKIINYDSGKITYNNKDIDYKTLDNIGYLIEEGSMVTEYTVYDQFCIFGILKNMTEEEILKELTFWLKKFNMSEYLNMKIKKISKGNKQKIQFIVSVMHNPDLLILDEPFSGLDPVSVKEMKDIILELKSQGKIILFSSHQMQHVQDICDDILFLDKGKMYLNGNLNEIKNNYGIEKIIINGKIDEEKIKKLSNVQKIISEKNDTYEIFYSGNKKNILEVINESEHTESIVFDKLSLEDIFIDKVGIKYEE